MFWCTHSTLSRVQQCIFMDSKVTLIYRLLSSCRLDSDPFLTHMALQLPCVYYLFHILYYILPLLRIGRFSKRFSQHRPARQIQPVSHILLPFILFLCIVYWPSKSHSTPFYTISLYSTLAQYITNNRIFLGDHQHSGPPGYYNMPKIECHEILFIYLLFIINYQPVHMLKTRIRNLSKCRNNGR